MLFCFGFFLDLESAVAASSTWPLGLQLHQGGVNIFVESMWYLL